jgi:hypothetical protein
MNITLSLDDELAAEDAASGRRCLEREALERTFESFQFRVGKRTRKRGDLYARS